MQYAMQVPSLSNSICISPYDRYIDQCRFCIPLVSVDVNLHNITLQLYSILKSDWSGAWLLLLIDATLRHYHYSLVVSWTHRLTNI